MVFHHDHHHVELHKALHDPMSKLYIFQAVMTFVKSLIGIFVPVYLYKLGFSIPEVLLYTAAISLTYLIMIPLSVKTIKLLGFKYTILLSVPIYFLHILVINYLNYNDFLFHLAWLSFGIYMAIFWPSMHSEIAVNGSSKNRSSQIGTLQIISTIFATLAPLIGGMILQYFGYFNLMIFSSFFIVFGILPLLFSKDKVLKNYDFDFGDYAKLFRNKQFRNSKKAFSSEGIETLLSLNVWPVILFILLENNFLALGALFTFVSFLSVIIIVYIKSYLDTKNKNKVLSLSARFLSFNWFLRSIILFVGSIFLYFIESFFKLVNSVFLLSFSSIFYNNAKKSEYMDYIIFRELFLHSSYLSFFIIIFFGDDLKVLLSLVLIGIIVPIGLSSLKEH